MKKFKSEKGVITLITLITVLFMVSFLITSYILVANKVKTQKEILSETKEIYRPKSTMEEIYNSYFASDNIIPISTVEQLLAIGKEKGKNVNINGKKYTLSNTGTYLLMNSLEFNEADWQDVLEGNRWQATEENSSFEGIFDYNNYTITVTRPSGTVDIYDGTVGYVDGMVLWLDGIQNTRDGHVDDLTVWHDISGNNYDYNMTGVTTTEKSVIFAGTADSYGELYDSSLVTEIFGDSFNSPLTIEAVVSYTDRDSNEIICSNNTIKKAMRVGYNRSNRILVDWIGYSGGGKWYIPDYSEVESFSIVFGDDNSSYRKGSSLTINDVGLSANASKTSKVGRWFGGKGIEIYSIRVYPRQLTQEEMWQNFKADELRFAIDM